MIVFRDYPYYPVENEQDVKDQIREICNVRKDDIAQISNLVNTFVAGRKVGKIPSASSDVAATDRLGDVNYDQDYLYILIDDSGTAAWRRVLLEAW